MDIPDFEELAWLEANALIPEDEGAGEEEEPPVFYDEEWPVVDDQPMLDDQPPTNQPAVVDQPPPSSSSSRKRPLPTAEEEKEEGIKRRTYQEEDEDWLIYSPAKDEDEAEAAPPPPPPPEDPILSRFASEIQGNCMPITGPSGDRVYAKLNLGSGEIQREEELYSANGLLYEPYSVLKNRLEQEDLQKVLQESIELPDQPAHSTTPLLTEQLWVEKYAPSSFKELLSDEQTNREILLWLKQWDSCVFGSQIRTTTDDVLSALRRHSSIAHHHMTSDRKPFFNKGAPFNNHTSKPSNGLDGGNNKLSGFSEIPSRNPMVDHPPEQKVLLLCGPPGLGKTTLAHVAAKHCGYGVVEINASDDRSSSTFESKILDVMQMKSVMGDTRPKCLVIDEIDGSLGEGKGAVEVILKMVAAEKNSTADKGKTTQEVQPGKTSRKGHKTAKLLRPVICICNDLYAPALRPLRQVAKVHTFVQPTISRVVNRLKYICKKEGFKSSSIALSTLVEHTECDIRSCLNTLQFLHKKKETLNILDVGSQVVGRKDMSRSVFDVWKEVFQKRKLKSERKSLPACSGFEKFNFMYSLISNCGDYELTMNGIHENFLGLSYHDPMMQKTVRCLDEIGFSDSLLQHMWRTHQMSLNVYQPILIITMWHLIAQIDKPNIEWPKSLYRCRTMLTERKDLLKLWHNKMFPSISRHLSAEAFVEDVVSPLLHILSPPSLKPVALHLLSEKEKEHLFQLVDTMVSYSITYKHTKFEPLHKTYTYGSVAEAPVLSLDPPIGDFVKFKDYQSGHFGLSLAMKQVLVHEVEKQRILRESVGRSGNVTDESNNENQALPTVKTQVIPAKIITTPGAVEGSNTLKAAHVQRRQILGASQNSYSDINKKSHMINMKPPGDSKKPVSHSSNFFDRYRKRSGTDPQVPGDTLQKAVTMERDSRPLLFKYNEGFTNAVKRPVKVRELLL